MGIGSDGLRLEVADGRGRTDRATVQWSSRAQKPSDPAPAAGNPICCACPEFKMVRLNRKEADLFLSMVSLSITFLPSVERTLPIISNNAQ